jgi:hypothetical protein
MILTIFSVCPAGSSQMVYGVNTWNSLVNCGDNVGEGQGFSLLQQVNKWLNGFFGAVASSGERLDAERK